jgi:hypothetical protein
MFRDKGSVSQNKSPQAFTQADPPPVAGISVSHLQRTPECRNHCTTETASCTLLTNANILLLRAYFNNPNM